MTTIYLDMDDVVADWMGFARAYLNQPQWQEGQMLEDRVWRRLKDAQRMYRDLAVKEGAIDLVNRCRQHRDSGQGELYFLSAIPHGNDVPWAVQDKVFWAQQHFPDIPVFLGPYSNEKYQHCRREGDILIDDRRSNCEEWIRAGGRAHIYRSWQECEPWLEQQLNTRV